jgi:hypothetical protein
VVCGVWCVVQNQCSRIPANNGLKCLGCVLCVLSVVHFAFGGSGGSVWQIEVVGASHCCTYVFVTLSCRHPRKHLCDPFNRASHNSLQPASPAR